MSDNLSTGSFLTGFKAKQAGGVLTLLVGLALAFFQLWMDKAGRDFASAQHAVTAEAPPPANSSSMPPGTDYQEQPPELETAPAPAQTPEVAPSQISTTATEPYPATVRKPRIIRNEITVPPTCAAART